MSAVSHRELVFDIRGRHPGSTSGVDIRGQNADSTNISDICVLTLLSIVAHRQPSPGLIHHTDRGAVYSARAYREVIESVHGQASMNGKKSAYDNAVAESFFSNLKNEVIHHSDFKTRDHARVAVFDYIELYYNRKRPHQSLDYRTPEAFEREWRGA